MCMYTTIHASYLCCCCTPPTTTQAALNISGPGFVHAPLSGALLASARDTVSSWQAKEISKRDNAKAKNDLESYIISTREALETSEPLQQVIRCNSVHIIV